MKRWLTVMSIPVVGLVFMQVSQQRQTEDGVASYRYPVLTEKHVDQDIERLEREVERTQGQSAMSLNGLAGAYMRKARAGDHSYFAKAKALAERSLVLLRSPNPSAHVLLAEVAMDVHEFDRAIGHANDALADNKRCEGALCVLVTANLAKGVAAEADRASLELLRIMPRQRSHALQALVQEAKGDDDAALASYRRALSCEDLGECEASAWTRTFLARFHFERGRPELARGLVNEALRIRPGFSLAQGMLSRIRAGQGLVNAAVALGRAAYQGSGEAVYLVQSAEALVEAGYGDDARTRALWTTAEPVLRNEVENEPTGHMSILARLLLGRGDAADAPEALALAEADAELRQDRKTLALLARARAASRS